MLRIQAQSLNEQQTNSRVLNQLSFYRPNTAILQKRVGEIIKKIKEVPFLVFICSFISHTCIYALSLSIVLCL